MHIAKTKKSSLVFPSWNTSNFITIIRLFYENDILVQRNSTENLGKRSGKMVPIFYLHHNLENSHTQ